MNKNFHPLLIPATLGHLDTHGALHLESTPSDPADHTSSSYLCTSYERGHTFALTRDDLHSVKLVYSNYASFISKLAALEKCQKIANATARAVAAGAESGSKGFFSEEVPRWLKAAHAPLVIYRTEPRDDHVGKLKREKDEVADLREELYGLKQQVAYLTELVTLRAEAAPDPLAAAKARGASYKANELANPDNLNLVSASKYARRSDRMINMERNRGWLYALVPDGNSRGYRYPKWQFDVPAARLRSVLEILTSSSLSCWALHNFLMRPHSDLDGKSPSAALADDTFAVERVIDLARRRINPQQGAS